MKYEDVERQVFRAYRYLSRIKGNATYAFKNLVRKAAYELQAYEFLPRKSLP